MSSRMRRPETAKLEISRGDWLLVKQHLTAGERRASLARMLSPAGNIEPINVGWTKCIAYLLDWSFTDADDKPLVIQDQPPEVVGDILNSIDADAFAEVLKAIEQHEEAMEKNDLSESASPAISPSPVAVTGGTSG